MTIYDKVMERRAQRRQTVLERHRADYQDYEAALEAHHGMAVNCYADGGCGIQNPVTYP